MEKFAIAKGTWNPSAFRIGAQDASGYVLTVEYGNQSWTGDMFAEKLGLPSSHFTLRPDSNGDGLVIVTTGIGSGFGMSLNEAKAMARRGESYASILKRFYPGTKLEH
jgi:stage II sporulation protein D